MSADVEGVSYTRAAGQGTEIVGTLLPRSLWPLNGIGGPDDRLERGWNVLGSRREFGAKKEGRRSGLSRETRKRLGLGGASSATSSWVHGLRAECLGGDRVCREDSKPGSARSKLRVFPALNTKQESCQQPRKTLKVLKNIQLFDFLQLLETLSRGVSPVSEGVSRCQRSVGSSVRENPRPKLSSLVPVTDFL